MENIKAYVEELVKKFTANKDLLAQFKSDPQAAVRSLVSDDIGDDIMDAVIAGIKTRLDSDGDGKPDGILGAASGIIEKAKDLIGK